MMTAEEKRTAALEFMLDVAHDQTHGYSQQNRWGPDYDCSSLVIFAFQQAGVPVKTNGATYTGNMKSVFLRTGFEDVTKQVNLATGKGLKPSDVLLHERDHTAMYCGGGDIVHARGQSHGSPKTGDQGSEIAVTRYYNYPWQCVLRYTGGKAEPTEKRYAVNCSLPMLQNGSEGDIVMVWQIITGADVDGEFGPNTEYATKLFQSKHGLEVDGIVGPISWAAGLNSL